MSLPGASAVKAVTAAAKDLETALNKLRKSKSITANMRQPLDNMDGTLTATLNDMHTLFPDSEPANAIAGDVESIDLANREQHS